MTTARDMVQDAFETMQIYAPGETLRSADATRGLVVLNRMIDEWSMESLLTFALQEQSTPLTPGKNRYSLGPGGDINLPRPNRILYGSGAAYLLDSNYNRYQVDVFPQDKWNQIWNLQLVTSNLPNVIFYDPQYPLGYINVYPMPNQGNVTLFWDSYLPLARFTSLSQNLSLPPGYEMAIETNLAIHLKRYYPSAVLGPDIVEAARVSKGNIKRNNQRENLAGYDKDIGASKGRPYNIYSDTSR